MRIEQHGLQQLQQKQLEQKQRQQLILQQQRQKLLVQLKIVSRQREQTKRLSQIVKHNQQLS
ncbi:hypothetical protein ARNL5_01524 [Anaerolineae bacterium]|nr:hypothetical protein ARNL5_01524 [Anaerolineae bacterium]